MKKTFNKVLSVVLSIAMIATSITVYNTTAKAATLEELTTMIADASQNLALKKATELYPGVAEGDQPELNDGAFGDANEQCAIGSPDSWGYSGESYVVIDLGAYYDASTLDEIVIQYKDAESNDTVVGRTYKIQYSMDYVNYYDAVTETSVTELDENRMTIDNVSGVTGTVKYIKVDYPTTPTYGIQITEIAVLAANPQEAELEECDDAAGVTLTSNDYNSITYNITAGEGQEDYTYMVYLDDVTPIGKAVVAGQDYTLTGITKGEHTVNVVANYDGKVSAGITSNPVTVADITTVFASTKNIASTANNQAAKIISTTYYDTAATLERAQKAIDGTYKTGENEAIRTQKNVDTDVIIDLGASYKSDQFDMLAMGFTNANTDVAAFNVAFSTDNVSYTQVASESGYAYTSTIQASSGKFDMSAYSEESVRYVKITLTGGGSNYGYVVNEIGIILNVNVADAVIADTVEVDMPSSVVATSNAYNKITATVTAPSGDGDYDAYTYEVIVNDEVKIALAGEEVTFENVPAGTYTVNARSVDAAGNKSEMVSSEEVIVKNSFTYSQTVAEDAAGLLFLDENANGVNHVRNEGVKDAATASSGNAGDALDNNSGTRWESASSDPQWICVDLGDVYQIKEIDTSWETANSRDYHIEVSTDNQTWTKVAMITGAPDDNGRIDTIVLNEIVDAQYVRLTGTARNTGYGHSIWEMAIYGPVPEVTKYDVTVDGVLTEVEEGAEYTLPTDATYGYFDGTKMYKSGAAVTVTSDMTFTSVNEEDLSVETFDGASIRFAQGEGDETAIGGIRFKTTVAASTELLNSEALTTGTLITVNDYITESGSLTLESEYAKLDIRNEGWFDSDGDGEGNIGTYCGSIVNINESNWIRKYAARGYVTITYADGSQTTVYSDVLPVRSIKAVAQKLVNRGLDEYNEAIRKQIEDYAAAAE